MVKKQKITEERIRDIVCEEENRKIKFILFSVALLFLAYHYYKFLFSIPDPACVLNNKACLIEFSGLALLSIIGIALFGLIMFLIISIFVERSK